MSAKDTFAIVRMNEDDTVETACDTREKILAFVALARPLFESVTVVTASNALRYEDVNRNGSLSEPYR